MCNYTGDEGRSFEFDNQVLISNLRKPLWSKAMVVNVAEKSEQDFGRYDSPPELGRNSFYTGAIREVGSRRES
jgi:hypothetical protein